MSRPDGGTTRAPWRGGRAAVLTLAAGLALTGCGGGTSAGANGAAPGTAGADARGSTTITVLAAASLRKAFTELGAQFHREHPTVTVRFSFAGSPTLVQQVLQGAPADVLATADQATMSKVTEAGQASGPAQTFATNRLEIAVPKGNPGQVRELADLTRPGLRLAVCAVQVPCGAATQRTFDAARLTPRPVTYESDVKAVLAKVDLGEVDAGMVYRTDVAADPRVDGVPIPAASASSTSYPIVALRGSAHPDIAARFVALVLSASGQKALAASGFGPP